MDFSKLKVAELRKELKNRGLNNTGNKNELLERLQAFLKTDKKNDNEVASDDLEEDLLNEEDDDHIEDSDSVLNELDSTLDKSPLDAKDPTLQGVKRKSDGETTNGGPQVKKIVLNRTPITAPKAEVEEVEKTEPPAIATEKKVVKLSELSAKERLEMRAKKFGAPVPTDAKKVARAERFGTVTPVTATKNITLKNTPIAASGPPTADVLKQRAERFGVTVSTTLTKIENQERLEKRKQRFHQNGSTPAPANNTTLTKAQQRLERFKQPVK